MFLDKRFLLLIVFSVTASVQSEPKKKNAPSVEGSPSEWVMAESRAENAVVQLWAQGTEFNWLDPYKSPDQKAGVGSGFFINKDGYLLSNYHVVAGAKSTYITVPGVGRHPLEVFVVGVCPDLDIALLKLTPESYKIVLENCGSINALEFGNSDLLYNNERVLALGFPLGFHTRKSTTGTVGGRDFINGQSLVHITAAINPGNSGGPLLNKEGKVIGINTSGWDNAEGYNYIVPINDILIILDDLYSHKLIRRPDLGIGANRGTQAHARALKNPLPAGLYINFVMKDSMEDRAGMKSGDMLYELSVKGVRYAVDEFGEVSVPWRKSEKISVEELLSRCHIGDQLGGVLYRNGEKKEFHCKYETTALPAVREIFVENELPEVDYEIFGGVVVMQMRLNHLKAFEKVSSLAGLREFKDCARPSNRSKPALVITRVLVGSQADLTGCLTSGFILNTINGKEVTTLQQLRDALALSAQTGEIAIETKDKYATVLDLEKVMQDEERLSRDFMFPISETMRKLMRSMVNRKP